MLEELRLASVGGIAEATLNFGAGLIAVTGESGAGKSSLVRGLELVCGKRASAGSIRAGDETAAAEAFFGVDTDIDGLDDALQPREGSFSMKRELLRSGRGKSSIQGRTVPLNILADTAPSLITIQSQFAQLELLDPERQLRILDACGGRELRDCRTRLETVFYQVLDIERELRQNKAREREVTQTYGELTEIAPILERLKLESDSEDKLAAQYEEDERELRRLRELRGRFRVLRGDEEGGLISELSEALDGATSVLSGDDREKAAEAAQMALSALDSFVDMLAALAPAEKISAIEDELEEVETTLGLIRKCKRAAKAGSFAELIDFWHKGEEELRWLGDVVRVQNELTEKATEAKKALAKEARTLLGLRTAAARELERRVSVNLADLAMEHTQFRVRVTETNKLRANGAEKVDFVLLRGDTEIPVAKAASGGELSRLLLAIQVSLPPQLIAPTVVFDEVEAGLGGRAAYLTGLKLRDLSTHVQVILITHEASIAAMANQHYKVERSGDLSSISLIEGEERVREIARMLSGRSDDEEALAHARKLLKCGENRCGCNVRMSRS